jgi:hypothetical protein
LHWFITIDTEEIPFCGTLDEAITYINGRFGFQLPAEPNYLQSFGTQYVSWQVGAVTVTVARAYTEEEMLELGLLPGESTEFKPELWGGLVA